LARPNLNLPSNCSNWASGTTCISPQVLPSVLYSLRQKGSAGGDDWCFGVGYFIFLLRLLVHHFFRLFVIWCWWYWLWNEVCMGSTERQSFSVLKLKGCAWRRFYAASTHCETRDDWQRRFRFFYKHKWKNSCTTTKVFFYPIWSRVSEVYSSSRHTIKIQRAPQWLPVFAYFFQLTRLYLDLYYETFIF